MQNTCAQVLGCHTPHLLSQLQPARWTPLLICYSIWLCTQDDGNLVLLGYDARASPPGWNNPYWSSGAQVPNPSHCILQLDGNFVCYDTNGTAYWETSTAGIAGPAYTLALQGDGNLVLYGDLAASVTYPYPGVGAPVWSTQTARDISVLVQVMRGGGAPTGVPGVQGFHTLGVY
jgi:hypothetical protein